MADLYIDGAAARAFDGALRVAVAWTEYVDSAQQSTRRLAGAASDALFDVTRHQTALSHGTDDPVQVTRLLSVAQDTLEAIRHQARRHGEEFQARSTELARSLRDAIDAAPSARVCSIGSATPWAAH